MKKSNKRKTTTKLNALLLTFSFLLIFVVAYNLRGHQVLGAGEDNGIVEENALLKACVSKEKNCLDCKENCDPNCNILKNACEDDKAYRKYALKYYPDKVEEIDKENAKECFQKINNCRDEKEQQEQKRKEQEQKQKEQEQKQKEQEQKRKEQEQKRKEQEQKQKEQEQKEQEQLNNLKQTLSILKQEQNTEKKQLQLKHEFTVNDTNLTFTKKENEMNSRHNQEQNDFNQEVNQKEIELSERLTQEEVDLEKRHTEEQEKITIQIDELKKNLSVYDKIFNIFT